MTKDLNERLIDKELSLVITDEAKAFIAEHGYDPVYGARPLKRYLQKHVDTLVAKLILEGNIKLGSTITIDVENEQLVASL